MDKPNMRILALSTLIAGTLIIGCNDSQKSEAAKQPTETGSGSPAYIDKYNLYIEFANSFHDSTRESYNRYLHWADYEKGPKGSENVDGISLIDSDGITVLEDALKNKAEIEGVDNLMTDVLAKAISLQKVIEPAYSYYDKQDYKDDDFAKGQTMHTEILQSFEEYFASYDKMYIEFKKVQEKQAELELKELKDNGKIIRYNLLKNLHSVEDILNLIGDLDGPDLKTIDLEAFDNEITKFRETADKLEEFAKDDEKLKEEFGIITSGYSRYVQDTTKFIKETRNFKERIKKSNFKYNITHPSIPASGSPAKLYSIRNAMIDHYNGLN